MKIISLILLSLLLIAYPLVIYFGLDYFEVRYIGLLLVLVLTLRFFLLKNKIPNEKRNLLNKTTLAGILLGFIIVIFNQPLIAQFYPVLMSLIAFIIFAYSLFNPPTIIELFARIQQPDLPESGIQYTRKVTIAWCLFFIINGSIATYTALSGDLALWTLYNGLISYLLMGLLFGIEFLIRIYVKKQHAKT